MKMKTEQTGPIAVSGSLVTLYYVVFACSVLMFIYFCLSTR